MPRMQVYLPDDLYQLVKTREWSASEILQRAVRAEVRRLDLLAEHDRYLADLVAEVGPPTEAEHAAAEALAARLVRKPRRKAG